MNTDHAIVSFDLSFLLSLRRLREKAVELQRQDLEDMAQRLQATLEGFYREPQTIFIGDLMEALHASTELWETVTGEVPEDPYPAEHFIREREIMIAMFQNLGPRSIN